MVNSVNS